MSNKDVGFEHVLGEVVRQGLARADTALLRKVAERLWYEHAVPDLGKMPARLRPDAGYLVDRLARVNVLPKEQKQKVLAALEPFKTVSAVAPKWKDQLAVAWGASAELTSRMGELMPYQTRHYALSRRHVA